MIETHPDNTGLVCRVTLEARPRGGPLGLPYTSKKLEKFQMAVQRLFLIHPRELKIPAVEEINPVAKMKALPEDSEKVQDAEVKKVIEQEKNNTEDVASDSKALEMNKPEDI